MESFKERRERLFLSQSTLAKHCGVKKQTVWHWEHGFAIPRLEHQRLLIEALQCTRKELLAMLQDARERRIEEDEKERPAA